MQIHEKVFYSGRNIFLNIVFNVFILGVIFIIVQLIVEHKGYFLIPFLVLGIALVLDMVLTIEVHC